MHLRFAFSGAPLEALHENASSRAGPLRARNMRKGGPRDRTSSRVYVYMYYTRMSHGRIRVQRRRHSRFTYKIRYRCSEYVLLIRPTGMWDSKPMKAIMQGIPIEINDAHGRTPPWAGPEQLGGGFASGMAVRHAARVWTRA